MSESEKKVEQLTAELAALRQEHEMMAEANRALNERVLELYTLYNVSRTLSMSLQVEELFSLTMNVLGQTLDIDQYCLMLLDRKTGSLMIRASHGLSPALEDQEARIVEGGVSRKVFDTGQPVMVSDISRDKNFFYFPGSGISDGSYLGVPLTGKDGNVIGVLNAHKPEAGGFRDKDTSLFDAVAEHVAIAIENAMALQQTRELANRDDLTNLYNRRYFYERMEREVYRAVRYERAMSLLMVDIDHFKNFNDTFGHLRGDDALKRMARIMEKRLRKSDLLARFGGEEFLIMLPETCKASTAVVGEKLRDEVAQVDFNDNAPGQARAGLTITIGVAGIPDDAKDAVSLIDYADKALYFGKAKGKNQICTEVPAVTGEDPAS